jgi:hypothetical protein
MIMKRILLLVLCTLFISQFGFAQEADSLKTDSTESASLPIMSDSLYRAKYLMVLNDISFIADMGNVYCDKV